MVLRAGRRHGQRGIGRCRPREAPARAIFASGMTRAPSGCGILDRHPRPHRPARLDRYGAKLDDVAQRPLDDIVKPLRPAI
jgi:hypothetical protein